MSTFIVQTFDWRIDLPLNLTFPSRRTWTLCNNRIMTKHTNLLLKINTNILNEKSCRSSKLNLARQYVLLCSVLCQSNFTLRTIRIEGSLINALFFYCIIFTLTFPHQKNGQRQRGKSTSRSGEDGDKPATGGMYWLLQVPISFVARAVAREGLSREIGK